jgi:TolA-binding protein
MAADPSLDIDTLIVASAAVAFSVWTGISSNRTRRDQVKMNREKAEDEAFVRVQTMYTTALKTQEDQLTVANNRIAEQNRKIHELEEENMRLRGERYGHLKGGTEPA